MFFPNVNTQPIQVRPAGILGTDMSAGVGVLQAANGGAAALNQRAAIRNQQLADQRQALLQQRQLELREQQMNQRAALQQAQLVQNAYNQETNRIRAQGSADYMHGLTDTQNRKLGMQEAKFNNAMNSREQLKARVKEIFASGLQGEEKAQALQEAFMLYQPEQIGKGMSAGAELQGKMLLNQQKAQLAMDVNEAKELGKGTTGEDGYSPLTTSAKSSVQKDLIDRQETQIPLASISSYYESPEELANLMSYAQKGESFVKNKLEKLGYDKNQINNELARYSGFSREVKQYMLQFRKFITGVAGGEREMRDIEDATLNMRMSPSEFEGMMRAIQKVGEIQQDYYANLINRGIPVTKETRGQFNQEISDKVKAALSPFRPRGKKKDIESDTPQSLRYDSDNLFGDI